MHRGALYCCQLLVSSGIGDRIWLGSGMEFLANDRELIEGVNHYRRIAAEADLDRRARIRRRRSRRAAVTVATLLVVLVAVVAWVILTLYGNSR
jgi:hypothetical protein